MQHFLQSPAWEKYQSLEQKTTFRRKGEDFEYLALLETTPLGNYLYLPYGPTLYPAKNQSKLSRPPHTASSKSCLSPNLAPKSSPNPNSTPKSLQTALQHALEDLANLSHEYHATFARIEPTAPLFGPQGIFPNQTPQKFHSLPLKSSKTPPNPLKSSKTLKKSSKTLKKPTSFLLKKTKDLNPADTWVLDLTQPEAEILNAVEKTKTRHYRNYSKKGITIKTSHDPKDIKILTKLLKSLGEKDNFIPQNESHLKNQLKSHFATLYIAYLGQLPIAAALIYDDDTTRYYAHAAADQTYKNLAAGTILIIQMILDAKAAKQTTFDFWGIAPENSNHTHPWYGFSLYKKSFGGQPKHYAGTYDIIYHPLKYRLYTTLRALNRYRRKFLH